MSVVECDSILLRLGLTFTLYGIAFAPPRKSYWIGLLFTQINGDFGGIFVTERNCATPISKVKSWIGVHTEIPGKSVCPIITAQLHSIVRKSLRTVSAFSQFFQSSSVDWKISNLL